MYNVLLMVDLNTRFGNGIQNILLTGADDFAYPVIPDQINVPNENANIMATECIEQNLMVVNNLKDGEKYYRRKLTYRKRNEWITEVDVCIASQQILRCIQSFSVNNDVDLPSDHAP